MKKINFASSQVFYFQDFTALKPLLHIVSSLKDFIIKIEFTFHLEDWAAIVFIQRPLD